MITKISEFQKLVPHIIAKTKSLKTKKNKQVERIFVNTNPALTLISKSDLSADNSTIKKENVLKIKQYFETIVIPQIKNETPADYFSLYCNFKDSIEEQFKEVAKLCEELVSLNRGLAENFFQNYSEGHFNDTQKFQTELENLVAGIASKKSPVPDVNHFNNIKQVFNTEKQKIVDQLKNISNQLIQKMPGFGRNLFNNSIILKPNEGELVSQWLATRLGTKKILAEMLYNTKDHGFAAADFHKRCDNKGARIVIVETQAGRKFGGYAHPSWWSTNNGNKYKKDEKCFLFSVDLKEVFPHKVGNAFSIEGNPMWGPLFGGGCDLYLNNNCNVTKSGGSQSTFEYNNRTHQEIGMSAFKVANYEVFLIKSQYKYEKPFITKWLIIQKLLNKSVGLFFKINLLIINSKLSFLRVNEIMCWLNKTFQC